VTGAFAPATLDFLAALRAHNNRDWFDAHRRDYERDVLAPAKEFVRAAAPRLERLAPGIRAEPRVLGSIFRINRDTRFSPDKRPYKDHLDFWFWHGERAAAVSGLFLRLQPDEVWVGAGAHGFEKQTLARYRAAVCDPAAGGALAEIGRALDEAGIGLREPSLRRPPSGFTAAPEAAPYLLRRELLTAVAVPVSTVTEPDFLDHAERRWAQLAPLHLWLVANVQA
jgi:uncharacterized protein (TIGR02453 family)